MLEENLQTDKNQDRASEDLGFGFVATTEDVADL